MSRDSRRRKRASPSEEVFDLRLGSGVVFHVMRFEGSREGDGGAGSVRTRALAALAVGLIVLFQPGEALAYLDAGSASMVFQALIASVLGGLVLGKAYWRRIKAFFGGTQEQSEDAPERDDAS